MAVEGEADTATGEVPRDGAADGPGAGPPAAGPHHRTGPETHPDPGARPPMTPRQARRVRTVVSAAVMAVVVLALALRVGSGPSLLVLASYGFALVLSGSAVALSQAGRTRVATGLLGCAFALVAAAELLLS